MEKQIKMYNGDMIAKYTETEEKKQMLWDAFIKWCGEHNASSGESFQNDNFQIDAPEFMADAIDKIVQFNTEFVSQHDAKLPVICCGVLELMNLGWMKLEDGTRCMPYIKGHSDENMYRVNNCPSCGKYVRDVMV